jgi:CheY-like chemotaxis protein
MVRTNRYNLVFMDHMMPGMDGIEAAAAIRAWETEQRKENPDYAKGIPIIALTANAIAGMKELFLKNGFNDYLSKPIEIATLDEMIRRWIPREKQIKTRAVTKRKTSAGTDLVISGVDAVKGIKMTGGTEAGYRKVLAQFYRDIFERLPLLEDAPGEEGLPAFTAQAHALKGAAAAIGAAGLSAEAAALETAGKTGDTAAIRRGLPGFYKRLKKTVESIRTALEAGGGEMAHSAGAVSSPEELEPQFRALKKALEGGDIETADRLLDELKGKALDATTREIVETVSNQALMFEFEAALKTLESIGKALNEK